jgi:hypothetical protein
VPDAVRRAQAVPQAVHDLILAQRGGLGDLRGRVFARQRGGADAGPGNIRLQRLERCRLVEGVKPTRDGMIFKVCPLRLSAGNQAPIRRRGSRGTKR